MSAKSLGNYYAWFREREGVENGGVFDQNGRNEKREGWAEAKRKRKRWGDSETDAKLLPVTSKYVGANFE